MSVIPPLPLPAESFKGAVDCPLVLGSYAQKIKQILKEKGLETPVHSWEGAPSIDQRYQTVRHHLEEILKTLHLDINHPDLRRTPHRVAKMYVYEIFSGLDYQNFPEPAFSSWTPLSGQTDGIVSIGAIEFNSHCMHHFSMMQGKAKVAYFPKQKLLGLSKVHRLIRFFAARPQLQELFTAQCLVAFQTILETEDVLVAVRANHGCVRSRGIQDSESMTQTLQCGGRFSKTPTLQTEFLSAPWD